MRTYDPEFDLHDSQPPLAVELRVPILTTSYTRWHYITGVIVEDDPNGYLADAGEMPNDNEIRMIGSFLEDYCQYWYRDSYRKHMQEFAPYDIDGAANLALFCKRSDGTWCYRKKTWEYGPFYVPDRHEPHQSLEQVLDRVYTFVDDVRPGWLKWKAAHPDVFPAAVPS